MSRRKRRARKTPQPQPQTLADSFVLRYDQFQIHHSAHKHGLNDLDIRHAYKNSIAIFVLDQESYEVKILIIGPDNSGNLLEVIGLEKDDQYFLIIHAMKIRKNIAKLTERRL